MMFKLTLGVMFVVLVCAEDNRFGLNIVHYNDFHARFEETNLWGNTCDPTSEEPCVAGFARLTTAIREALAREPHSLLLNAGDSFQGTIWYNILRWNVTQDFMNMIPHDAHVLGNHEFDNGIEGVVPYLQHLDAPVVTANIIDDEEEDIQGLYKPSIIVEKNGRRIGIIGVIIASTNELSSPGNLKFTDEVQSVRNEAEKLNNEGVDIIIVLSHCGLDKDREIALNGGPFIDVIVGGHSHTLLYNGEPDDITQFSPQGPYPVVVEQDSRTVIIVQAAAHTLYLGEIKVFFDDNGNVLEWYGNPRYIGNEIEQAPDIVAKIREYLPSVEEIANQVVGGSMVHLSNSCTCRECNLGSLICDALLDSVLHRAEGNKWHYAHFCAINQGSIRTSVVPGQTSYANLLASSPFENKVEVFDLRGDHIMEMLEYSVANVPWPGARMMQYSGLRVVFDGSLPVYSRVVSVSIRCIECTVPRYEPLVLDKYYKMVTQSFIGLGGDGFSISEIKSRMRSYPTILSNKLVTNLVAEPIISGLRVHFDGSQPVGSRVVSVALRCIECDVPKYEPLELDKYYKMVSTSFIGSGGGGYYMISDNRLNVEEGNLLDYEVLMDYYKRMSPVFRDIDGRIEITDPCIEEES